MKTNALMDAIRKETPKDVTRRIELATEIANRIYDILDKRGLSQKEFARLMGKTEPEISRWLSGMHNLTIATIAKIESVLGEKLVYTKVKTNNVIVFLPMISTESSSASGVSKNNEYKLNYKLISHDN